MRMTKNFLLTPWMGFLKAFEGRELISRHLGILFLCRVFFFYPLYRLSLVKMTDYFIHFQYLQGVIVVF